MPRALDQGLITARAQQYDVRQRAGFKPMEAISYSTARAHLARTMNKVCENHEPVVITRRGEKETTFLLRSPANAQRLLRSIAGLNSGGGEDHDLLPCD